MDECKECKKFCIGKTPCSICTTEHKKLKIGDIVCLLAIALAAFLFSLL